MPAGKQSSDAMTDMVSGGLLRITEAAKFLGVSRSMIYKLMDEGKLAHVKMGKSVRVPKNAVVAFAADCVVRDE